MGKRKGKIRRHVVKGIVHIKATFNNTMITITDVNGETLCWESAGTTGQKGSRKSTPYAATQAAAACAQKARKLGMNEVEVRVKGPGPGREAAVRGLHDNGLRITAIEDCTSIPHNGCRPRKRRRV